MEAKQQLKKHLKKIYHEADLASVILGMPLKLNS